MGQKTNPNLFRLVAKTKHLSNWYTNKKNYSKWLKEDNIYRNLINDIFEQFFKISKIKINRYEASNTTFVYFNLILLYPGEKEFINNVYKYFLNLKDPISQNIISILSSRDNFNAKTLICLILNYLKLKFLNTKCVSKNVSFFKIKFVETIYEDSLLIAKSISEQIKKRVPYRRIMKQILEFAKYNSIKGIMIELSGRLNGIEMARSEVQRYGTIPLHTLNANIDYSEYKVNTIYGIIGIKVWLYKN